MTKTTADRLTSADINRIVRLRVTNYDNIVTTDIVGVLVGIEESKTAWGDDMGIILHIGVRAFAIDNPQLDTAEVSFPED